MAYSTGTNWTYVGTNTATSTVTFNYTWNMNTTYLTGGNSWVPPKKVKNGKYRVRCRGCARWAKIIDEKTSGWGNPVWKVHCSRCFGENEGFAT